MTKIVFLVAAMTAFSCSKETDAPAGMIDEPIAGSGNTIASGMFESAGGYRVSGTATVIDNSGTKTLRLENFSSSNGPDLKVYLAKDARASSFISLGDLKAISGNQNYAISGMPDLKEYPFVLVWCQQFGALFGSASLK
jgi:hypothetical protein